MANIKNGKKTEIETTPEINSIALASPGAELIKPADILTVPEQKPGEVASPTPQTISPGDLLTGVEQAPEGNAPAEPAPGPILEAAQAPTDSGASKRKRGRPFGSRNRKPGDMSADGTVNFSDIDTIATITPEAAATDYQALAELSFDMGTSSLSIVFSDDWNPKNDAERGAVVAALKRYFEHKQVKDIPPGALLALVLCSYAAPRLNTPTTKGKLLIMWLWMKSKFQRKSLPKP